MKHVLLIERNKDNLPRFEVEVLNNVGEKFILGKHICSECYTEIDSTRKKYKKLKKNIISDMIYSCGLTKLMSKPYIKDLIYDEGECQIFVTDEIVKSVLTENTDVYDVFLKEKHFIPKEVKTGSFETGFEDGIAELLKGGIKLNDPFSMSTGNNILDILGIKSFRMSDIKTSDDLAEVYKLVDSIIKSKLNKETCGGNTSNTIDKTTVPTFNTPLGNLTKEEIDTIIEKLRKGTMRKETTEPKETPVKKVDFKKALVFVSRNKTQLNMMYDYKVKKDQKLYKIAGLNHPSNIVSLLCFLDAETIATKTEPNTFYVFTEAAVKLITSKDEFKNIIFDEIDNSKE